MLQNSEIITYKNLKLCQQELVPVVEKNTVLKEEKFAKKVILFAVTVLRVITIAPYAARK
jgi:hypothetical protein